MGVIAVRILLVDDDEIFCDVILKSLKERGLRNITRAGSAEHALQVIDSQETPFDAYLLDIMLGEMNGIELCRHLRRRADCKAAPIIMITGSQETQLTERAFEAGATDFLRKPLDNVELAGRINTAMLLVVAAKKEQRRRDVLLAGTVAVPGFDTLQPNERVCFSSVTGMMDGYQLENRLHCMKEGVYQLNLFRIHIQGFEQQCSHTERLVSLNCLRAVSEQVSNALSSNELLLSYVGHGRFLCCIVGGTGRMSEAMQDKLRVFAARALKKVSACSIVDLSIAVSSLSDCPILTKATAIKLVRQEQKNDQASDVISPIVQNSNATADNIFGEMTF